MPEGIQEATVLREKGETMRLQFIVPGLPRPKERPRKGKYGNMYTPRATQQYELEVWTMALSKGARQDCFKDRPLSVSITFTMRNKQYADADNLAKSVLDGCKPMFDDRWVESLSVLKIAGVSEQAEITVEDFG
jgi:crossover junction endodeoxyribonuclease RusA